MTETMGPRQPVSTLEELIDRYAIEQLQVDYADAMDRNDLALLDALVTPDCSFDHRAVDGPCVSYPAFRDYLASSWPPMGTSYLVSNFSTKVSGVMAHGKCLCLCLQVSPNPGGTPVIQIGLSYGRSFRKTNDGWRISSQVLEVRFVQPLP